MIKKPTLPKQKRAVKSRQHILDVAVKLFAAKGPAGTRVDEIEALSGLNKQRIYAYFSSKENLYREALLKIYSIAIEQDKLLTLSDKNIPDMTEAILNSFFDFHEKNPRFWRLLAWDNLNGGGTLTAKDWGTVQSNYLKNLSYLYGKGQEQGYFKKDVSFTTYLISLFAVSFFYFSNQITISNLLNLNLKGQNTKEKFIEEVLRIITAGCVAQ